MLWPMSDIHPMKAAVLEQYGEPLKVRTVPVPNVGSGEVRVKIHASGVNPLDTKIQAGAAEHARQAPPAILGLDLAGVIDEVGPGVTRFKPGDEVFGMVGGVGGHPGTLAQFASVDARLLALKPRHASMREAAALPLVFITAWEGLVDRANLQAGEKVLIHGGGGGVGHIAIQIARARGAEVFATDSLAKRERIERLGATFIDYHSQSVADYVARLTQGVGFDVIYDTVGGASLDASFEAVRRFGHVVSSLGWGTHRLAPLSFRAATYSGVFTLLPLLTGEGREHHGEILEHARQLMEAGKLVPEVDPHSFTLESVNAAYEALRTHRAQGKLVVDVIASPC